MSAFGLTQQILRKDQSTLVKGEYTQTESVFYALDTICKNRTFFPHLSVRLQRWIYTIKICKDKQFLWQHNLQVTTTQSFLWFLAKLHRFFPLLVELSGPICYVYFWPAAALIRSLTECFDLWPKMVSTIHQGLSCIFAQSVPISWLILGNLSPFSPPVESYSSALKSIRIFSFYLQQMKFKPRCGVTRMVVE